MKLYKKIAKWIGIVVAIPIALFLVLAIIIYIPPVQDFAVKKVTTSLSESMEMDITVEKVRLAFPIDLAVHGLTAVESGDTLVALRSMRLHVPVGPLFLGRADIDGFELYGLLLDTKEYVADIHVKGTAEELTVISRGVEWGPELVNLNSVKLKKADFQIALSDTAEVDTTETEMNWVIYLAKAEIEDTKINLSMPGDSMCLGLYLGKAVLEGGEFDLGKSFYAVKSLNVSKSGGAYTIPGTDTIAGLDPNHLVLSGIGFQLDTLSYDSSGTLRLGLQKVRLEEKSGLKVSDLSGSVYMDSTRLDIPALNLRTPYSTIDVGLSFDFRAMEEGSNAGLTAKIDASIGPEDLRTLATGYVDEATVELIPELPLNAQLEVGGNVDQLDLKRAYLQMPDVFELSASGEIAYALQDWRNGTVKLNLQGQNLADIRSMIPADMKETISVPDGLSAQGTVSFRGNVYNLDLCFRAGSGSMTANGKVDLDREGYSLTATAQNFPVGSFVKGMDLSPLSCELNASGSGFDVLSSNARLQADAKITAFSFGEYDLQGIAFKADMRGGKAAASFVAINPIVLGRGKLEADLASRDYTVTFETDIDAVNLLRLGLTEDSIAVGTRLALNLTSDKAFSCYSLEGSLSSNHFTTKKKSMMAKTINFDFMASADTMDAHLSSGDMTLSFSSLGGIERISEQLTNLLAVLSKHLEERTVDYEALKKEFPVMSLSLDAGQDNPIYNVARFNGYAFDSLKFKLQTDPVRGISGGAAVHNLNLGSIKLDTIYSAVRQDTSGVQIYGLIKNDKDINPVPLELRLKAYVLSAGLGLELAYFDSDGEKGVEFGLEATGSEEGLKVHMYPEHPVMAYRSFTINSENYIILGRDKTIRADLDLVADDGTGLKLFAEPVDSANDITLTVNQVNLDELSTVMPYMPKLGGLLSGLVHVTADFSNQNLSATAQIDAEKFSYESTLLGNIGFDAFYTPAGEGEHQFTALVRSEGQEVMTCEGSYFDTEEGNIVGEATLHDFPLQMLNGFMVGTDVLLSGNALGQISIEGSPSQPMLNGKLELDSAHIYSDVYGFDFLADDQDVEMVNSRVVFTDYNLYSTGSEPLTLNGAIDMADLENITLDLKMKAKNFELINTKKKSKSMLYGKLYVSYDGIIVGSLTDMRLRGNLEVLDKTDMTYVLKDSPLTVEDRLNDLVQFVSFRDTMTQVVVTPEAEMKFDLSLSISVSEAAIFHCSLSEDGQSYVDIEGGGDITFRMTQSGEMRLTGRFTVNSGEMKYSLPVIPLKTFTLQEGSYVEFTGDAMNPTLNITATERTKALVSENDQQRSVTFDVGVAITKPLNEMGLEFTIEAPEDLTIQNELASMSAEQRGKVAVTMMATGMYITDDSSMSGTGFKTSNALNAFLQSEIQNIAGSALQTIDINLGVESNTSSEGTTTTDYSFQFAKRFWGNRVSVIIGGKVSTGEDAQNSAESFISNISIEYRLDQGASRYVKVFYDRDVQDPLEGQLTKTGAGLVLKRKTNKLGELFIFKTKKDE